MAELGTGKSVVVLAIVVGCFSILWPKIFYPMMQSALSLTAHKYDGEDARCQFMLDAEATGYAFFANLCNELVSREPQKQHEELQGDSEEDQRALPSGLSVRCQKALRAVCHIELPPIPSLEISTAMETSEHLQAERKRDLARCLQDLVNQKKKRRQIHKRKPGDFNFFGIEIHKCRRHGMHMVYRLTTTLMRRRSLERGNCYSDVNLACYISDSIGCLRVLGPPPGHDRGYTDVYRTYAFLVLHNVVIILILILFLMNVSMQ